MHRMFRPDINPKQTEHHPYESHSWLFQNVAGDPPRSCRGSGGGGRPNVIVILADDFKSANSVSFRSATRRVMT
jgi:hypothetical protein